MSDVRNYYLLTGATGLLGRYLLRNLLLRDIPVAVVVRGTRQASPEARIESLMLEIEASLQRRLPRPVVLEGELTAPQLNLAAGPLAWARRNVRAILHNAASLSFQKGARDEEPWLSNLTGTQCVLDLARAWGVREYHHVSTAYVCGQRRGRVLESELDEGQTFGNDYEQSKLEAEKLVRAANWLDPPTIYRPGIIVGDSQTAFTNTFHGFYTPLHIVHAVVNKLPPEAVDARSLVEVLGLSGTERKNLVPVDWVAAVIVHLLTAAQHHGRVYHLTPQEATPVDLLCEVFQRAVAEYSYQGNSTTATDDSQGFDASGFQLLFRQQMSSYQAYWRDDPVFDTTNTTQHSPHLPCPRLDASRLLNLCKFAIEHKFWWSRGTPVSSPFHVETHLEQCARRKPTLSKPDRPEVTFNLCVSGLGGGEWQLQFDEGRLRGFEIGRAANSLADVFVSGDILHALVQRQLSLADAQGAGAIAIVPRSAMPSDAFTLLEQVFAS